MSSLSSSGGFDPSPWIAANAALAARLGAGRRNGFGLSGGSGSFPGDGLVGRTITGGRDEERARRLRGIGARGAKGGAPAVAGPDEYIIKAGDTFAKIARAHGTTIDAMQQVNPGVDSSKLKIGQKIKMPKK